MLATRCGDCYILGFIGANREFRLLYPKKHTEGPVYRYLNQFDAEKPDAFFEISKNGFSGISLARSCDYEAALIRFPHLQLYPTRIISGSGKESVFTFEQGFKHL
jgi:hypothetical protein